jgi:hypothetical protein
VDVHIEEQPIEHARIPIAFKIERILTVSIPQSGFAGIHLQEMTVEPAWVKDYDEIKGEGPTRWLKRFDTSHWGLIAASRARERIGGAVIAFDTLGIHLLGGARMSPSCGTSVFVPTFARRASAPRCFEPLNVGAEHATAEAWWWRRRTSMCPPVGSMAVWAASCEPLIAWPRRTFQERFSCCGAKNCEILICSLRRRVAKAG